MKKLFTVLVAIALIASFASAQEVAGVGPKVQLNLANWSGDVSGTEMTMLLAFGGFIDISIVPEFNVQAEVLYDQKGFDVEGVDASLTMGYISINALAKYNIQVEGDIKPAIFAGPSVGILMAATANPGGVDMKDTFEPLDYGIIFGAGASVPVGEAGSIVFDARYNLGLANILKIGGSVASIQNQVISVSVGFAFKP